MRASSSRKSAPLTVGIIGAGLMGGIHAQAYARERGCRVAGVYNPTPAKARRLAARLKARVYDSWQELIADDNIQAVSIASPQTAHAEQAVAALHAGRHVLCEKPLALTLHELDAIRAAARDRDLTVMVGHQLRFHPVVAAVASAMPRLGAIYHLDLEWALRIDAAAGRCWTNYRQGGFFMELGCHLTDLAACLMGPVASVSGHTLRLNPARVTEDHTNCLLQFETGAVGAILVSANHRTQRQGLLMGRVLGAKGRIDFTIYPYGRRFNKATLTLDHGKSISIPDVTSQALKLKPETSPVRVYPGFFEVYQREIHAFATAIRSGGAPPCTLEDGARAVELVLATYDSQARATPRRNFATRPGRYRSGPAAHPALDATRE